MNIASSEDFYENLPVCESLWAIADPQHFTPVPVDWFVALTDVVGSTQAIAAGRYKEVNTVGACSIVAALNAVPNRSLPFVFGGDGATLLVPPGAIAAVETALLGTQAMARRSFDLDLRVGIVPVADVVATHPIAIAKLALSPHYHQALLAGGALPKPRLWSNTRSGARRTVPLLVRSPPISPDWNAAGKTFPAPAKTF